MMIKRAPTSGRGVARGLASMLGIPGDIAEAAGEPAIAAMMALKLARDAGGARYAISMLQGRSSISPAWSPPATARLCSISRRARSPLAAVAVIHGSPT